MEILAPAGSIAMLKIAVAHGADAVYLGLDSFSARAKATDFTTQNIAFYVAYCHKFGVKVYVTLNTLVKARELTAAVDCAETVFAAGADAVLVQDPGLAAALARALPELVLHASTQLGVHNAEGAQAAKDLGFRRVVLARETPFAEIEKIAALGIETEVFAHGALCVSFSGNCYYSALVAGNSGNRGRCLQLCRKEYAGECARGARRGRLLSPSDLCLIDRVSELAAMGVTAIKIEGRLKRPEYAGVVVDAYRRARSGAAIGREDYDRLSAIYARGGFTQGYADGGCSARDFVGGGVAGHLGLRIGAVTAATPNSVTVRSARGFDAADGFKIVRDGREVAGASHPKALGGGGWRLSKIGDARVGDEVYLTTDAAQLRAAAARARKIPLDLDVRLIAGEAAVVSATDGRHRVTVAGPAPQAARTAPLDEARITAAAARLGAGDYEARKISVATDGVFYPLSQLNELRRSAVEELEKSYLSARISNRSNRILDRIACFQPHRPHALYLRTDRPDERRLPEAAIVYAPADYRRIAPPTRSESYLELPAIAFSEDLAILEAQIETVRRYRGVVAENLWALRFASRLRLRVIAGFRLNLWNAEFPFDYDDVFASPENDEALGGVAFGFGEFPLMTFAHCPYRVVGGADCARCAFDGNLVYRDDRGKELRVRRNVLSRCYFTLNDALELPPRLRQGRMLLNAVGTGAGGLEAFLRGERVLPRENYFERVK